MQIILTFLSTLSAAFFGAFFAFLFNNQLQKMERRNSEKTKLLALIIDSASLSDRLLQLKIKMQDSRYPECLTLKKELPKIKKIFKQHSSGRYITEIMGYRFEAFTTGLSNCPNI